MILRLIFYIIANIDNPVIVVILLFLILNTCAGVVSVFYYVVYLLFRRRSIISIRRHVKLKPKNLILVFIGWPDIMSRLYDMIIHTMYFHFCIFEGRYIRIMLEEDNIIRREEVVYNNNVMEYREYEDKYVTLYENIKDETTKDIEMKVSHRVLHDIIDNSIKVSPMTLAYLRSISDRVPTFEHVRPQQKCSCRIREKDFDLEFQSDVYKMVMPEIDAIYVLKNRLDTPYKLEESLYNEFQVINDDIYIVDYLNNEVYTISNDSQTLFGKFSVPSIQNGYKLRLLEKYRWYSTDFSVEYDENSILKSLTASDGKCYYLRIESEGEEFDERTVMVTYFTPFVHTSDGVLVSNLEERIYCTKEVTFDTETNLIIGMRNTYRVFSPKDEEELQRAFNDTVKNADF